MTLRRRGRRHIAATDTELWWDFQPGQRVLTREGFFGVVTAVEDAWVAGNEQYLVELEGGMGGGEYAPDELSAAVEDDDFDEDEYLASVQKWTSKGLSKSATDDAIQQYTLQGIIDAREGTPWAGLPEGVYEAWRRGDPDTPELEAYWKGFNGQTDENFDRAQRTASRTSNMEEGYDTPAPEVENPFDEIAQEEADMATYASEIRLASDDYPELADILIERPPLLISQLVARKYSARKARYPKVVEGMVPPNNLMALQAEWDRLVSQFGEEGYGVPLAEWNIEFGKAGGSGGNAIGHTNFKDTYIAIADWAMDQYPLDELIDTLRHEVAHVLAGPAAQHGWNWKARAFQVGAHPEAAHRTSGGLVDPGYKWFGVCPEHGMVGGWFRKPSRTFRHTCGQTITITDDWNEVYDIGYAAASLKTADAQEDLAEATDADLSHAGLIIKALDTGRVLMTQRTLYYDDDEDVKGKWEFPGGGIDDDEEAVEAAVREFQEETGLTLPDGWELGGAYSTDMWLGIIIKVPSESWTTDATLLDNETMGIGWFEEEEADILFRGDSEVEWETIHEAKTADMGWFTDKVLFPMAEAFDSGLEDKFQYDPSIGTFPGDVDGVMSGEFSPENPYLGAKSPCSMCDRNTRNSNQICIVHQEGYDNLLLAIEWERTNSKTAALNPDEFEYREPKENVSFAYDTQKWSIIEGNLKDGTHVRFFIDENQSPGGVVRLEVTYLEGSGPEIIDYRVWHEVFDVESLSIRKPKRASKMAADGFIFHFTAAWADVQEKAKRIKDSGYVRVISASPAFLVGEVRGDTNIYQSSISYEPGTQRIATWECGCAWASYSWARSGPWKKYEGRFCSHVQALQWEGQSRGMFNQEVEEDAKKPSWMSDPSITVQRPGDYKTAPYVDNWRNSKLSWGEPSMTSMNVDQLRALLQMAQAEGQSQVEQWVRDEMRNRGVYSSKEPRAELIFQSKMDARDWLTKAMTVLLAAGISAGSILPVVDTSVPDQAPPAITQPWAAESYTYQIGDITVVSELPSWLTPQYLQEMTNAVSRAGGTRRPITFDLDGSGTAHATGDAVVSIRAWQVGTPEDGIPVLLHEIAHVYASWGSGQSSHTEAWAEIYVEAAKALLSQSGVNSIINTIQREYGLSIAAELKDHPEPALPSTTAEEDEEGDFDPSLAWIMEDNDGGDMDIATAAKQYLGTLSKEARAFSVAEQQELINEGEGELARNFDSLDITGTHYEWLEEDDDEDFLW